MLAEWHLTPEYLLEHWTDEQLESFWQARNHRMVEMNRSMDAPAPSNTPPQASASTATRRVSDQQMFQVMGIAPQGNA